jgi:molecular chaperone DnaK (HSP70)
MNEAAHRYAVGIDLGTTHCVLSYIDLDSVDPHGLEDQLVHEIMLIPQLTSPGSVEELAQLPSFIYQAHPSELQEGDITLPWSAKPEVILGAIARELGSKTPIRLVSSAKSWLCHSGIDRHAKLLPPNSPEEVPKISPLEASYHYLAYLRDAWDHRFPDAPLIDQDVTITVPASFDPAARELTADAARSAGFKHLTLLEEPQSALYSWIRSSGESWREQLTVGDIVLVIDIGGGTTDLSLVAVAEEQGNLTLNRVAIGDHILLGGDNMDLALAYCLKAKLAQEGKNLQPWQIQAITQSCRDAKEAMLGETGTDAAPIVIPSRGSKMLGSTLRTELTREDVTRTLIEGFFPKVAISDHPVHQARGALTQMGLPYAQDAAVPRHLAAFLCKQHGAAAELLGEGESDFIKPTAILFNGGVLKAPAITARLMESINDWLGAAGAAPARQLQGVDLDLAVASGASYYAYVRRGRGVRIRGGLASAYYVGVESAMPAVPGMDPPLEAQCVAPFGMEEGSAATIPGREFGLVVGEPVKFRFFGSTVRRDDDCGTLLDYWEPDELEELPEIQITLPAEGRSAGEVVPVSLTARVGEVGTLRLEAISREGAERWQVEFDVRER